MNQLSSDDLMGVIKTVGADQGGDICVGNLLPQLVFAIGSRWIDRNIAPQERINVKRQLYRTILQTVESKGASGRPFAYHL
jgi:hypothetical protein